MLCDEATANQNQTGSTIASVSECTPRCFKRNMKNTGEPVYWNIHPAAVTGASLQSQPCTTQRYYITAEFTDRLSLFFPLGLNHHLTCLSSPFSDWWSQLWVNIITKSSKCEYNESKKIDFTPTKNLSFFLKSMSPPVHTNCDSVWH